MRVLIVGGGGREHALAWKLKQEEPSIELVVAPGNPGIAELAECVPIPVSDLGALEQLAHERRIDLTIVGPEAPLAAGIVDRFRAAGLAIFGPTQAAAEIETSKAFAKRLMLEDGIPTARAEVHTTVIAAREAARRFGAPVVIKASGLASGKGVIVCETMEDADAAIKDILEGNRFGAAGAEVLIEEFMDGEELSVFALTDGVSFVVLPALQDHKRLLDNDAGPNTGGMGAYAPVTLSLRPDQSVADWNKKPYFSRIAPAAMIIGKTLRALARRERPFTGLLYAGLMVTDMGLRVIEFNCRFGDPETQALMPLLSLKPRLLDLMLAIGRGEPMGTNAQVPSQELDVINGLLQADTAGRLTPAAIGLQGACVTTVLAAANYPETPRTGDRITMPAVEDGVFVFHAGTARDRNGQLVTAGGRVLAVSALAPTIAEAQKKSQAYAERIEFAGKQMRSDIGVREIERSGANARTSGN